MNLKIFGGTPEHVAREFSDWLNAKPRSIREKEVLCCIDQVFLVLVFKNKEEPKEEPEPTASVKVHCTRCKGSGRLEERIGGDDLLITDCGYCRGTGFIDGD